MLLSVLGLGFLIGMQHATEADHVAAVCSMASGRKGVKAIARHGVFWGVGHTVTLLLIAGGCLLLRATISEPVEALLESLVGAMLVGLGAHVLYRLWRDRVHFHAHRHEGRPPHFHAHSHRDETAPHARSPHAHEHSEGLPWRTLAVGLMHGMAGSASLIVLTAATLESPAWGVAYILLFGFGTIVGMGLLSAVIAAPITLSARSLTAANSFLQLAIGALTIVIGAWTLLETAPGVAQGWL
jgi:ABC-type nickel/cobalt efflux system permease component RcnA